MSTSNILGVKINDGKDDTNVYLNKRKKPPVTKIEHLSLRQKYFAELLADPQKYKLTNTEFAEMLGVSQNTITAWRRLEPLQLLALKLYKKYHHIKHARYIHEAVAKRAQEKGGAADARLYLEHLARTLGEDIGRSGGNGNTFNVDKMILVVREESKKNNGQRK